MARGRDYEYMHIDRAKEAQDDWYLQRRKEIGEEDGQVQTKLEISQPGDVHEQEADKIASTVVNGGNAKVNTHASASSVLPSGGGTEIADAGFKTLIESSKGSGDSLDESTRSEMESKMGADFSDVKIHTGAAAHEMSQSISAKAFTHGQDVYFKNGNYDTNSSAGKELLAHELVHTVQQGGQSVNRKIIQRADDKPEYLQTFEEFRNLSLDELEKYAQKQADWYNSPPFSKTEDPKDERVNTIRTILQIIQRTDVTLGYVGRINVGEVYDQLLKDTKADHVIKVLTDVSAIPLSGKTYAPKQPYIDSFIDAEELVKKVAHVDHMMKTFGHADKQYLMNLTGEIVDNFPTVEHVKDLETYMTTEPRPFFQSQKDFHAFLMLNIKVKVMSYRGTVLHDYIRNIHRFTQKALDQLIINYSDTSKTKRLVLIFQSGLDHNGALIRNHNITQAILTYNDRPENKDNQKLVLLVEGRTTLGQFTQKVPELAGKYGKDGRIDQMILVSHGQDDNLPVAGKTDVGPEEYVQPQSDFPYGIPVETSPLNFTFGSGGVKSRKLFKTILTYMNTDLVTDKTDLEIKSRIVLYGCLTNTEDVPVNMTDPNPVKSEKKLKEWLAKHNNLVESIREMVGNDTNPYNIDKVIGAMATHTDKTGLINENNEFGLYPGKEDPGIAATDPLEFVKVGREPDGLIYALLASWAKVDRTKDVATSDLYLAMNGRVTAADLGDDFVEAGIACCYRMIIGNFNNAKLIQNCKVYFEKFEKLYTPPDSASWFKAFRALGVITPSQSDSILAGFKLTKFWEKSGGKLGMFITLNRMVYEANAVNDLVDFAYKAGTDHSLFVPNSVRADFNTIKKYFVPGSLLTPDKPKERLLIAAYGALQSVSTEQTHCVTYFDSEKTKSDFNTTLEWIFPVIEERNRLRKVLGLKEEVIPIVTVPVTTSDPRINLPLFDESTQSTGITNAITVTSKTMVMYGKETPVYDNPADTAPLSDEKITKNTVVHVAGIYNDGTTDWYAIEYTYKSGIEGTAFVQKSAVSPVLMKKSLGIGDTNNTFEREADTIAAKVAGGEKTDLTGITAFRKGIQRKQVKEEAPLDILEPLQRSVGNGSQMDTNTRSQMESQMGVDFSGVNIHTGSEASAMNQQVNAKAFTHGQDIYFGNGNYSPSTSAGKELLAHELVHTQQQTENIQRKEEHDPAKKEFDDDNQLVKDVYEVVTSVLNGNKIDLEKIKTAEIRTAAEGLMHQGKYFKADQPHRRLIAYHFIRENVSDPQDRKRIIMRKESKDATPAVQDEFDYLPKELLNAPDVGFNKIPEEQRKTQVNADLSQGMDGHSIPNMLQEALKHQETWQTPEAMGMICGLLYASGRLNDAWVQDEFHKHDKLPQEVQRIVANRYKMTGLVVLPYLTKMLRNDTTWRTPEILFATILVAKFNGMETGTAMREVIHARKNISPAAQEVLDHFGYDEQQFNLFPKMLDLLQDKETWQDENLLDLTIGMLLQMGMGHDPAILDTIIARQKDSAFSYSVLVKHGWNGSQFMQGDLMTQELAHGGTSKIVGRFLAGRKKIGSNFWNRLGFGLRYAGLRAQPNAKVKNLKITGLQESMGGTVFGMQFMNPEEFRKSSAAQGWQGDPLDKVPDALVDQAGIIQKISHNRAKNEMTVEANFLPFAGINEVWPDATMRAGLSYAQKLVITYNWIEDKHWKDFKRKVDVVSTVKISIEKLRMSNVQYVADGEVYGIGDIEADTVNATLIHTQTDLGRKQQPDKFKGAMAIIQGSLKDLGYALMYTAGGNINKFMPDVQPEANAELVKTLGNYKAINSWDLTTEKVKIKNVVSSKYGLLVKEASTAGLTFGVKSIPDQQGKYDYKLNAKDLKLDLGTETEKMISSGVSALAGGKSKITVGEMSKKAMQFDNEGQIGAGGVETLNTKLTGLKFKFIDAQPLDLKTNDMKIYAGYAGLEDVSMDVGLHLDYKQMKPGDSVATAIQQLSIENMAVQQMFAGSLMIVYKNSGVVASSMNEQVTVKDLKLKKFILDRNVKGGFDLSAMQGSLGKLTQKGDVALAVPGVVAGNLKNVKGDALEFEVSANQLTKLKGDYLGAGETSLQAGKFGIKKAGGAGAENFIYTHEGTQTILIADHIRNLPIQGVALSKMFEGGLNSGNMDQLKLKFTGTKLQSAGVGRVNYSGSFRMDSMPGNLKTGTVYFTVASENLLVERTDHGYAIRNLTFTEVSTPHISLGGIGKPPATLKADKTVITNIDADITLLMNGESFSGVAMEHIHIEKITGKHLQFGTASKKYLEVDKDKTSSVSDINITSLAVINGKGLQGIGDEGSLSTGKIDIPRFSSDLLKKSIFAKMEFDASAFEMKVNKTGMHFVLKNPDLTLLHNNEGVPGDLWFASDLLKNSGIIGMDEIGFDLNADGTKTGYIKNPSVAGLKLYKDTEHMDFIEADAKIDGNLNFREGNSKFVLYEDEEQYKKVKSEKSWIIESDAPLKITHLKYKQHPEEKPDSDRVKASTVTPYANTNFQNTPGIPNYMDFLDTANGMVNAQLFGNQYGGPAYLPVKDGMVKFDAGLKGTMGTIMDGYLSHFPDTEIPPQLRSTINTIYDNYIIKQYPFILDSLFPIGWLRGTTDAIHDNRGMDYIGGLANSYAQNNLTISSQFDNLVKLVGLPLNDAGTGPDPAPSTDKLYFDVDMMENNPQWYTIAGGSADLRLSRIINYWYLKTKSEPEGAFNTKQQNFYSTKVRVRDMNATQMTDELVHQLLLMLSTATAAAIHNITNPKAQAQPYTNPAHKQEMLNIVGAWAMSMVTKQLGQNLEFSLQLNNLKFTKDTGKMATRLLNKSDTSTAKGTIGKSDVAAWRDAEGKMDLGLSKLDKTNINEIIIPGFAFLAPKNDKKINVGPTTIGANSAFQPANYKKNKDLDISSPDISIAGIKIEVKQKEK